MSPPVTAERIQIAKDFGLAHVEQSALVCRSAGLPFWASCTTSEKESMGQNIWGHDEGGVFSDDEYDTVTARNYHAFIVKVMNGATSNGVGPRQITWAGALVHCTGGDGRNGGYFKDMADDGLLPWVPQDNIYFGDRLLARYKAAVEGRTWYSAARLYNGKESYARDWVDKANQWRERLHIKGGPIS